MGEGVRVQVREQGLHPLRVVALGDGQQGPQDAAGEMTGRPDVLARAQSPPGPQTRCRTEQMRGEALQYSTSALSGSALSGPSIPVSAGTVFSSRLSPNSATTTAGGGSPLHPAHQRGQGVTGAAPCRFQGGNHPQDLTSSVLMA
jgi:hypothetical protein